MALLCTWSFLLETKQANQKNLDGTKGGGGFFVRLLKMLHHAQEVGVLLIHLSFLSLPTEQISLCIRSRDLWTAGKVLER